MKYVKYIMALSAVMSFSAFAQVTALSDSNINNTAADSLTWPNPSSAWIKNGTFVDVEQLRRVGAKLNKDQVRELISYPQFSEGFLHPRTWNYLFNFRTGKGSDYVTCQYQVHFDKDEQVDGSYWRDRQCEAFLKVAAPAAAPAAPVTQSHPLVLSADGMFAFGKSGLNDLQDGGRDNLSQLAGQIKAGYKTLRSIEIVGYTDRFGSEETNLKLSLARAQTAKQFLVGKGIDGNLIRTRGAGKNNPIVVCDGVKSTKVIACLMPNRRLEINVVGDI